MGVVGGCCVRRGWGSLAVVVYVEGGGRRRCYVRRGWGSLAVVVYVEGGGRRRVLCT